MLRADLLRQIKRLELKAGRVARVALGGEYTSAFKGQGMEFDEVREYVPGDDVRLIDWNVTARMNHPYVKVFREERSQTVMLAVDTSASLDFGTRGRPKREVAAEVAAVLAFLAIRTNDKVGLVLFSDRVERYIPPKKGRGHVWGIIRAILGEPGATRVARPTNFGVALDFLSRASRRRSLCVVVSDFLGEVPDRAWRLAARRHELVAIRVTDPFERSMPDVGLIEFEDAETGSRAVVDTGDRVIRSRYDAARTAETTRLRDLWRQSGTDSCHVGTEVDLVGALLPWFRQRARRRFRS